MQVVKQPANHKTLSFHLSVVFFDKIRGVTGTHGGTMVTIPALEFRNKLIYNGYR